MRNIHLSNVSFFHFLFFLLSINLWQPKCQDDGRHNGICSRPKFQVQNRKRFEYLFFHVFFFFRNEYQELWTNASMCPHHNIKYRNEKRLELQVSFYRLKCDQTVGQALVIGFLISDIFALIYLLQFVNQNQSKTTAATTTKNTHNREGRTTLCMLRLVLGMFGTGLMVYKSNCNKLLCVCMHSVSKTM